MSSHVSRPVLIALLATVVLGAVWFVALRPKSDSGSSAPAAAKPAVAAAAAPAAASGPNAPGVAGLKRAIDKAHGAVATSQQNAQQLQAQSGAASSSAAPATPAAPATSSATATPPSASSSTAAAVPSTGAAKPKAPAPATATHAAKLTTPQRVQRALDAHKVLVFLFYNPRGDDDRAMHSELSQIKRHNGDVVVLSAKISQLDDYKSITTKTEIDGTPTLLFFDKTGAVAALHGFADQVELNQRVIDVMKSGISG